jgi:hypothetical protein
MSQNVIIYAQNVSDLKHADAFKLAELSGSVCAFYQMSACASPGPPLPLFSRSKWRGK